VTRPMTNKQRDLQIELLRRRGMSHKQIAEQLGATATTVAKVLSRRGVVRPYPRNRKAA